MSQADEGESELEDEDLWRWPGLGGAWPTLVSDLEGRVKGVALGGWHCLALID
jgi:hypothetical protein